MSVFFTSDLHLGHEKVAGIRGFSTTAEHDDAIRAAWLDVVRPKDQVWVLGDLAVSSPAYALGVLGDLPGEKHLIWGNHDQGHPMHRDAHRKAARYLDVFASAQAFARRKVAGRSVLLSHFPYQGDTDGRTLDRHVEYRLWPQGLALLHGHTHGHERLTWAVGSHEDECCIGAEQIHVGLDAWGLGLVSLEQVAEILGV